MTDREVLTELDYFVPRRQLDEERLVFEQECVKNWAFAHGKQHFHMWGNTLVEPPLDEHEVRYTANFILPAVLRAVAKIMALQGRMGVAPESSSERHLKIARMSDAVLEHQRASVGYQNEKAHALFMAAVFGTAFLKNTFDPMAGDPQRFYWTSGQDRSVVPPDMLPTEGARERDRNGWFDDLPTGELNCEAVSPLQVFPDKHSKGKLEHCRRIFQVQYVDPAWCAEKFGGAEDDYSSDSANDSTSRWEEIIAQISSGLLGFFTSATADRTKSRRVRVVQMWERPSRTYKKGRFWIVAGVRVVANTFNPFIGDQTGSTHIPFVKLDWISSRLRFWGTPLVRSLINPQFYYNEARARKIEWQEMFGVATTYVPKNSVPLEMLTKRPGSLVEYNPAMGKPEHGPTPQMPPEVSNNEDICRAEMSALSSSSEIDGTKLPGQIRSGEGMAHLTQERDVALSFTALGALEVDRQCGRQFLALGQLFYDNERLLAIRGTNGQWAVKQFRAADLRNDLRIYGEPGQLETSEQYQSRIGDMIQSGGLKPAENPEHFQVMVKAMRFHTAEQLVDDVLADEEQEEEEIRRMLADPTRYAEVPYPIMPWENHAARKRTLERLFKDMEQFEKLDAMSKSVLATHWKLHDDAERAETQEQMAMIEAVKGAPGQKGTASQAAA